MTSEELSFEAQKLWTKAFQDLSNSSVDFVWYNEAIAREVKSAIEAQLSSPTLPDGIDVPQRAQLAGIAANLGQFLENEEAWFTAMLADMNAENAARLSEQHN